MDEKERILQEIRRVASSIEPEALTKAAFKRESAISESKVRYYFGGWNRAVEAAGLHPNPPSVRVSGYKKLSDEELLEAIGNLWKKIGRKPTEALMNSSGKFSTRPYTKRWGSLRTAIKAYIQKYGEPQIFEGITSQTEKPAQKKVPVIIPKTLKPLPTVEKKRGIIYGEPIDFRGLRYAPVNEQGVVYLFGLVSRELGFLIESIRTDFPDCEGKRCLNPEGTRWQHVRIEFEYKSSNFAEHGHDPEGCDLIVCWIRDWADAPLEILELKSAISLLPKD
jgi:hypothetical protein